MTPAQAFMGVARAPFLLLTPVCVILGLAAAFWGSADLAESQTTWIKIALTLIGAMAAHIAVNALNEWSDYRSGLDKLTERTPFSGGSGTLVSHPHYLNFALQVGIIALSITVFCGIYLALVAGPAIWFIGAIGVLIILTYTDYINKKPWLCLVAPGLGFGFLMVCGTYYVVAGQLDSIALATAIPVFLLVNNLLFLNQFPDVEADRQIGRHTIPIKMGKPKAAVIFVLTLALVYLSLALSIILGLLPPWSLLGFLTAPPALLLGRGVIRHSENIQALKPFMGLNVVVTLLTPALIATGMMIS